MAAAVSTPEEEPVFRGYKYDRTPSCYVVGAGSRGSGYAMLAVDDSTALKITGVAEPVQERRDGFARRHWLRDERYVCEDWSELLEAPKNADFVLICTLDHDHAAPAIAFMSRGYHVLVEKPMATTLKDCVEMTKTAQKNGVLLGVCHVLRYTPYTRKIKALIDAGEIGTIRSVNLAEPVGNWHFAHSYVRGNWRNTAIAAFALMAKSCHDIDWLGHVVGSPVHTVSCVGAQYEFTRSQKPAAAGSATRCVECPLTECPYNAAILYPSRAQDRGMSRSEPSQVRFPCKALVDGFEARLGDIEDAVRDGPYGQCVYECDNDQPDVLTAVLEFEGSQATFEMRALTEHISQREVVICGSRGEIRGNMETIELTTFSATGKHSKRVFEPPVLTKGDTSLTGHWCADFFTMNAFCAAVATGDHSLVVSDSCDALTSHIAVFAAEEARQTRKQVSIKEFLKRHRCDID